MSIAKVKQALAGDKVQLTDLEEGLRSVLSEEQDAVEAAGDLEDLDFTEEEFKSLLDSSAEEFMVELVKIQANAELASWLMKQDISENLKEDLVVEFLDFADILHEGENDLFFQIYTRGYLTTKEKKEHLPLSSSKNLVSLAVYYAKDLTELGVILPYLDGLNLSFFIQDHRVLSLPKSLIDSLSDKMSSKDALSLLRKVEGLSETDQRKLVQVIQDKGDADDCYFLVTTKDYSLSSNPAPIFLQAFKSDWFNFQSLSVHAQRVSMDLAIQEDLFDFSEEGSAQVISFKGQEIARFVDEEVTLKDSRLEKKSLDKIDKIFSRKAQILPERIPGFYNFKQSRFTPEDISLDCSKVVYILNSPDAGYEGFFLWKPDFKVPAVLIKKESKWVLECVWEKISDAIPSFRSSTREELKKKLTSFANALKSKIPEVKMNANRPFGVEIEICSMLATPSDIALFMGAEDLSGQEESTQSTRKAANPAWSVKEDVSIKHFVNGKAVSEEQMFKDRRYTAEIVTPKLYGEEGLEELKSKLTELTSEFDGQILVNQSCGLHVHHDLNDMFEESGNGKGMVKELLESELAKAQESIYSLITPDRRDNVYCPRLSISKDNVKQPELSALSPGGERIRRPRPGFNLFTGFGTIEFRMHEATLDVETIVQWVKMTHHLVDEIVKKIYSDRIQAVDHLQTTLDMMLLEKIRKLETEEDLQKAQEEIESFMKAHFLGKLFVKS